jgi:hypothetical protein
MGISKSPSQTSLRDSVTGDNSEISLKPNGKNGLEVVASVETNVDSPIFTQLVGLEDNSGELETVGSTNDAIKTVIQGADGAYQADVVLDNGGKKLLVKSSNEISSDLRILQTSDQDQELDDSTYFTIYSSTGSLKISGFQVKFSDKKVEIRLQIDGVTIFEIDCEQLKLMLDWNQSPLPSTYISWNDNLDVFYFTPAFPVVSQTSIVISARALPGQNNKKYEASIIQVG